MLTYGDLWKMDYEDLQYYMVCCYYACDHATSDAILAVMEAKYPDQYYDDLYGDD